MTCAVAIATLPCPSLRAALEVPPIPEIEDVFADAYADRGVIEGPGGVARGSNVGATAEVGEPEHSDLEPRTSVWVSWVAPEDGVASFNTEGSTFDTVLAVYVDELILPPEEEDDDDDDDDEDDDDEDDDDEDDDDEDDDDEDDDDEDDEDDDEEDNGLDSVSPLLGEPAISLSALGATPLTRLEEVTEDDDAFLDGTSSLQFVAKAGVRYEIVVDGFRGQTGNVVMAWKLFTAANPLPVIINALDDRAVIEGEPVELRVDFDFVGEIEIDWVRDGEIVPEGDGSELLIPSFSRDDLGRYQIRFESEGFVFITPPIEVQINSEGRRNSIAHDKLDEALRDPLQLTSAPGGGQAPIGPAPIAPAANLVRGFFGSQIFETLFASKSPGEPDHCDVPGGASYWLVLVAEQAGKVRIDTEGSNFDTVLAVYQADAKPNNFSELISVTCNNDQGPGDTSSFVEFDVVAQQSFYVVVDGVGGARGQAHLNYTMAPGGQSGSVAQAKIQSVRRNQGKMTFRYPLFKGANYEILETPGIGRVDNWLPVSSASSGTSSGILEFEVPIGSEPMRFFRVRSSAASAPPGLQTR